MSYTTRVISIGDLNVESGSGYEATLLQSYIQPEAVVTRAPRDHDSPAALHVAPGMSEYILTALVVGEGVDADTLDARRRALMRALDTTRVPVTVTIENQTGTARRRYMNMVVIKPDQIAGQVGQGFAARMQPADDVRWRSVNSEFETFELTATATHSVSVSGDLDVLPQIHITPTSDKDVPRWEYRRRFIIDWRSETGGIHTVDVSGPDNLNTAALLSAGKITDETNIGVTFMNSAFVRRDFGGFGGTTTKVWITVNFAPGAAVYLTAAVGASATTIAIEDGMRLPPSGALMIDSEIITYSGRTDTALHSVGRGAFDTTAASHGADSLARTVYVGYILYGPNATTPTPVPGRDDLLPNLDLELSTNDTWYYNSTRAGFNSGPTRPGAWKYSQWGGESNDLWYTSASTAAGGYSDLRTLPWRALGLRPGRAEMAFFSNRFALPISNVRVLGRRMVAADEETYPGAPRLTILDDAFDQSTSWDAGAEVYPPPPNQTFDVSHNPILAGWEQFGGTLPPQRVRWGFVGTNHVQADIQEMYVSFYDEPTVTLGAEDTDYDLDFTITNETTGEAITIQFPDMAPNETLVIDGEGRTVVYTGDGSTRYDVVSRNAPRPHFLSLAPGTNSLRFEEDGMGAMEVYLSWRPRWYT